MLVSAEEIDSDGSDGMPAVDASESESRLSIFDPSIRKDIKKVMCIGLVAEVIISLLVIVSCNLLYSFSWYPANYTREFMGVAILNLDDGLVGDTLLALARNHSSLGYNYKFHFLSSASHSVRSVTEDVDYGTYFAAVIVHANTSSSLLAALPITSNSIYSPATAISLVYDQARSGTTYSTALTSMGAGLTSRTRVLVTRTIINNLAAANASTIKKPLLVTPVGLYVNNLHPVEVLGLQNALGISFLQVYLVIMIHSVVILKMNEELQKERFLKSSLIGLMSFHRVVGALILSVWPGLVLLWLGAKSILSPANLLLFWMFTWLTMGAWGAICHHALDILGPGVGLLFVLVLIVLQLTTSGALAPYEAMPDFFKIGKGLPLKATVEGAKAILLGSRTHTLSLNIGILLGWLLGTWLFVLLAMRSEYLKSINKACYMMHLFRRNEVVPAPEEQATESILSLEARPILRFAVIKSLVVELILSAFLIALLFLMYGNAWDPLEYLGNCTIAVLNLDSSSSLISGALNAALARVTSVSGYGFNIRILDATYETASSVMSDVDHGKYWGALIIRNGTGSALSAMLGTPTAAFDNTQYLSFVIDQGRSGTYIYLAVRIWATALVSIMSSAVTTAILSVQTSVFGALNSEVLSNPLGVTFVNLHPVDIPGLTAVCSFTPVFIYFGISGHVSIAMKAHAPLKELNIFYRQRLLALGSHICIGSALYAFWPVFTIMWLGHVLDASTFFSVWAFLWVSMCAFGSMFMISYHVFGESAGILINIVVYTVGSASGGITVPHELQNAFFQIGRALPFHNIVVGLRYIFFGSGQSIGINVGVMLLWVFVTFFLAWRLIPRRKLAAQAFNFSRNQQVSNASEKPNPRASYIEQGDGVGSNGRIYFE